MKHSSTSVLLSGLSISFVLGFGSAWLIWAPDTLPEAATPSHGAPQAGGAAPGFGQFAALVSPADAGQATRSRASLDEVWAKGKLAKDSHQSRMEMQEQLGELARRDPAALRTLIQRFDNERDPQSRELLKAVLSGIDSPEVLALSARLASSGDPAQRQDAFELLKQLSSTAPEVRQMLKQALATEHAPAVLSQAIAALTPSVVAASESEAIVAQLAALSQHADPSVRSQSVLQLAQWDRSGQVEGRLQQALADQAPEVRQAAVTAIGESGIRSDSMKATLIDVLRNQNQSPQLKDGALHALERYSLSKEEFALYSQARAEVDKRFTQ